MVFCNSDWENLSKGVKYVTILILIDGFLQFLCILELKGRKKCHNPYFNRWFSAIGFIMNVEIIVYKQSQSLF